ncbi:hypothetical protein D3C81_739270 [compost metagenome]
MGLGFFAINGGLNLGHIHRVAGEQVGQFRHAAALADDVHGLFVQLVVTQVAAVFDLQAEATNGAQALNGRWREHRNVGVLNATELGVQRSGNRSGGQARTFAFIESAQADEGNTGVRAVGETVDRQAREGHGAVEARFVHGDGAHAADHRLGAIQAGRIRQLREGHQVLLVLGRHEPGRRGAEAHVGQGDQTGIDQQRHAAATDDLGHGPDIPVAGPFEQPVEGLEQPATEQAIQNPRKAVLGCTVGLEQNRRQCRRQGQRVERRDHRGDRDRQGELFVELPRQAGNERRRDEHRAQHQRCSDDRAGHLAHGFLGRFDRIEPCLDIALDVLHHDDRIVDHDADGQYQAEQRQGIKGKTEQVHHGKGTDQRHRYGDQWNDRGAPGLQEQDHHQHHQDQRFEQRMDHRFDRAAHEDGRVVDDLVVHAFREALLQLGHLRPHLIGNVDGIGTRALEDRHRHRFLVVEQGAQGVLVGAEFNPGYVLEAGDFAVRTTADDHVLELFFGDQAALGVDRHLEAGGVGCRR